MIKLLQKQNGAVFYASQCISRKSDALLMAPPRSLIYYSVLYVILFYRSLAWWRHWCCSAVCGWTSLLTTNEQRLVTNVHSCMFTSCWSELPLTYIVGPSNLRQWIFCLSWHVLLVSSRRTFFTRYRSQQCEMEICMHVATAAVSHLCCRVMHYCLIERIIQDHLSVQWIGSDCTVSL